jgi:hypothetical protein
MAISLCLCILDKRSTGAEVLVKDVLPGEHDPLWQPMRSTN